MDNLLLDQDVEYSLNDNVIDIQKQVAAKVEEQTTKLALSPNSNERSMKKMILEAVKTDERGDGMLFTELFRGKRCFDHSADKWYRFEGHYWIPDNLQQTIKDVDQVQALLSGEAKSQEKLEQADVLNDNPEGAQKHKTLKNRLASRVRILDTMNRRQKILKFAASGDSSLGITGDEWDRDQNLIGCRNGVLELDTAVFRPGRPEDFIRKVLPVQWRGIDEPAPAFERFQSEIFQDDGNLIRYLQKLFGYILSGKNNLHIMVIFWGPYRNGKGTLLETIAHVIGPLASPVRPEMLLWSSYQRSSGASTPDIMALKGKRLVWGSETNKGQKLSADTVKRLSGGDTLSGRHHYGAEESFATTHTCILLTNNKPSLPADDRALWERIHLISFGLSFIDNPKEKHERKRDINLRAKLETESSGILAWMIRGYQLWKEEGLGKPPAVEEAIREYRGEMDTVNDFIKECCVVAENAEVRSSLLYDSYKAWIGESDAISMREFGTALKKRFQHKRETKGVLYLGIKLLSEHDNLEAELAESMLEDQYKQLL